ncbi:uncharacterized protein J4E88_010178 [Alternaria novae-zelandiae]|uniref:uncharacterized protein n=1 Tax=Alternaria novae-zelandiae TaxID=430562 RepID=UPI0020C5293B|nr:uncharacterized protein J4E88_010178 [Alternaria novae-zelandiae]KAI4667658.1 hypothetical protein J4E88_010178 [Alternaria novae-zelandiae]
MSTSSNPDLDHVDNTTHGPVRPAKSDGPDSERSVNAIPVMDPSHPDYPPLRHTPDYSPQPHVSLASADADESVVRKGHPADTVPAGQLHGDTAPQTADYKIIKLNPPKEAENVEKAPEPDNSDDSDEGADWDKKFPAGIPRLAEYMARVPERAIFRTFRTLGVQNLLFMQAEIDYLEWKLHNVMTNFREGKGGITKEYATDWAWNTMEDSAKPQPKQYHFIMQIREKLEKYEEALLRQHMLAKIAAPDHFDLDQIKSYNVSRATRDNWIFHHKPLYGLPEDCVKYDRFHGHVATDLISLKSREFSDYFTLWVCERSLTIIRIFGRFLEKSKFGGSPVIYDSTLRECTHVFTAVLASLVPVAVAYISQQERDMSQIVVMASTNLLLSGCMVYFADAERVYLFLAGIL